MNRRSWIRTGRLSFAAFVIALLAGAPAAAGATTAADLRAGVYADEEAVALGGGVLTPVDRDGRWWFNPNAEFAFGDGRNLYTMNGDMHYDLTPQSRTAVWLGAGPAVLVSDPDRGDSGVDLGLNALAGVGAARGDVRPFAQMKGVIADNSEIVLLGGIRF
jgi:hypothetical protein